MHLMWSLTSSLTKTRQLQKNRNVPVMVCCGWYGNGADFFSFNFEIQGPQVFFSFPRLRAFPPHSRNLGKGIFSDLCRINTTNSKSKERWLDTSQLVDDADDPVHAVGLGLQRLAEKRRREELEYPHHFETSSRPQTKYQYPG